MAPAIVIPVEPVVVKAYKLVAPLILILAASIVAALLVALAVPKPVLFITISPPVILLV